MTSIVTRLRSQASPGEYMEPTLLVERYAKERVEAANVIEALTAALEALRDECMGYVPNFAAQVDAALALAKTHKGE
jgi:hypothetical protein